MTVIDFPGGKKPPSDQKPLEKVADGLHYPNEGQPTTSSNPFPWINFYYNPGDWEAKFTIQVKHDERIDIPVNFQKVLDLLYNMAIWLRCRPK